MVFRSGGALTGGDDSGAGLPFAGPAEGFGKVTASANMDANTAPNSYVYAYLYQDSTKLQSGYFDAGDNDGVFDIRQSAEAVSPVTAGAHTWTLRLNDTLGSNFSSYAYAQVTVEFFPSGSAPVGPAFRHEQ